MFSAGLTFGGFIQSAGGNARGTNAVDLQVVRSAPSQVASGDYSTLGGGVENVSSGMGATVGGGQKNVSSGTLSTVAGGGYNIASGFTATVGGGDQNRATGDRSVIPGGSANEASAWYSFAAGLRAKSRHEASFVWNGDDGQDFASTAPRQFLIGAPAGVGINKDNPASALDVNGTVTATSFTGNGAGLTDVTPADGSVTTAKLASNSITTTKLDSNSVTPDKLASEYSSLSKVSGGMMSCNGAGVSIGTASLTQATLHVGNSYATAVLLESINPDGTELGLRNPAGDTNYWHMRVAGPAYAEQRGRLIFANGEPGSMHGCMVLTPDGNVGIGTNNPLYKLDVAGEAAVTALNITSDRNAKEQFITVKPREVLEKMLRLPITSWQFKEQPGVRHIGPVAQDFHAAFDLGRDDKHIATVDADGVALAAIQGLHELVQEKDAELSRLKVENQSLAERLAAIERALGLRQKSAPSAK